MSYIQRTCQNMLDDKSYRNEDIYASIKELTKNKSINFKNVNYKIAGLIIIKKLMVNGHLLMSF